jgi:general secretion pathway protein K
MKRHLSKQKRQRGLALILVIFAVMFIGLIVVGLLQVSEFSWEESTLERSRFQAKLLAESGVALAMHPKVKVGDPVLKQELGPGRKIDVKVGSEGGRILVTLLVEDLFIETTRELFILWGLDVTEASIAAESLADWIDKDGEARASGAENEYYTGVEYPDYPDNKAFTAIDQMLLVRGMDRVAMIQPRWREYFTLYGDGTIDVNVATADLVEAFFACTPDAAQSLIAARDGNDLTEGTEDDYKFQSFDEVRSLLGMSGDDWARIQNNVTLKNPIRRIESTGIIGENVIYRLIVLTEGATDTAAGTPVARMEY